MAWTAIPMDAVELRGDFSCMFGMHYTRSPQIQHHYPSEATKQNCVLNFSFLPCRGVPHAALVRCVCEIWKEQSQQAIGYQKEIKKTLGKTSETDAYLKFEMTSYVKCQTDL